MIITIDAAGRLVVPKEIREAAHIEAGTPLDIRYRDGRIEIEPTPRQVRVVKKGRISVAVPVEESEPLTDRAVRATRDRVRERDR